MKKIFVLLLTFSVWSTPLYASEMNDLLKQNFKIVKTEIVKFERVAVKIFTLKKYKTIYELILSIKDPKYNILEEKEKDTYSKEEKLKLCSLIDSEYDNYNFNKKILSKSLICSNLQKLKDNYLSLILFYNEYFKINLVIFSQNNYYRTGLKNYDNVYIVTDVKIKSSSFNPRHAWHGQPSRRAS